MLLSKIKKIPKNTNGRLAIPALAGLLVISFVEECLNIVGYTKTEVNSMRTVDNVRARSRIITKIKNGDRARAHGG